MVAATAGRTIAWMLVSFVRSVQKSSAKKKNKDMSLKQNHNGTEKSKRELSKTKKTKKQGLNRNEDNREKIDLIYVEIFVGIVDIAEKIDGWISLISFLLLRLLNLKKKNSKNCIIYY